MTREFILNTLLEYKQDPSKCAVNNGRCMYLDPKTGNKDSVGKHLIDGKHQSVLGGINILFFFYRPEEILTKEAFNQKIQIEVWKIIQDYHDYMAFKNYRAVNNIVNRLESHTNFKFPELRYEETT